MKRRKILISGLVLSAAMGNTASFAKPLSPEQDTLEIAKHLKPIPDDQWQTIAGSHVNEKYAVVKGDTLWDISHRLFGDAKYWPKIWALNNASITNPHIIRPGKFVAFTAGSGTSLPGLSVGSEAVTASDVSSSSSANEASSLGLSHSQEWKTLPKQRWENVQIQLPPEVDPLGFSKSNIIRPKAPDFLDLPMLAETDALETLGDIQSSDSDSKFLGLADSAYIKSEKALQLGDVYAVVDDPFKLSSGNSRSSLGYHILGKIRITGVREGLFIGSVTNASHPIARGSHLIPAPDKIQNLNPVAGPANVEGTVMVDVSLSTFAMAQHRVVFIDRGKDDGVTPGMVFRVYEHQDPVTEDRITDANIIASADIIVLQTSPKSCLGLIMSSLSIITDGDTATLLTDVSNVGKNQDFPVGAGAKEKTLEGTPSGNQNDKELDELEKLEGSDTLDSSEERELKQLEDWKKNKDSTELPPPAPEGQSDKELLPPPPEEPQTSSTPDSPRNSEELPPPPASDGEPLPQ